MDLIAIVKAILLGFVEGMTEFAPVSSTGHMIIVDDLWLRTGETFSPYAANTFKVVIQLGSILAVILVFKDRFAQLLGLSKRSAGGTGNGRYRLKLSHVIVGLLPAGILGVLFEDYIDEHLFRAETVLAGLVVGAALMIAADRLGRRRTATLSLDSIGYRQAFLIGLFQCLSLWPGFSRSGSTISGGVLLGLSHRAAADFTFIMAVPIMLGASMISLMKNWQYITADALPFFIAGFVSAFLFALLSIRFFLKLIDRIKLMPFAVYRILLAVVSYFLYF
jgi:undecaprenyl-diphosphatase